MVADAQAGARGITRLMLARLTESGHLERLLHGVYRDVGAPSDQFDDLRAAWLSTDPKPLAEERLADLTSGVVVASTSAAQLHGVGDLWADKNEFVAATRRQSQRSDIRYRQRRLESRDVTLIRGLPVMVLERTLADLLEEVGDLSLVGNALAAALKLRHVDLEWLRELLGPLAVRNGFKSHDGHAVLEHLLASAERDFESVVRQISRDAAMSSRVTVAHLKRAMDSQVLSEATQLVFRRAVAEVMKTPVVGNGSERWAEDFVVRPGVAAALVSRRTAEEAGQVARN